ncbi:MAG: F0F1 ATP synthase subunit B [Actinomycetota bacterium]
MVATIFRFLAQAEGETQPVNDAKDLYPHWPELLVGALAFGVLFFFMWKWVLPRLGALLEERRSKIQGDLERAEETRRQAEQELAEYRQQLANAREESNRIIEEARKTAEQLRADIQARADREAAAAVSKAQEEIRAERDRVFQELRGEIGEIAVTLAGRVVGEALDTRTHQRLIDGYIDEISRTATSNGAH